MVILKKIKCLFLGILQPILQEPIFFGLIVLLLILPTTLNALWINKEEYTTFYKYGIKIRYGASYPYILFVPYVISYVLSSISLFCKKINDGISRSFKSIVIVFFLILFSINIFLLVNFKTMLSPFIIMLIKETNSSETADFFKEYLLTKDSAISFIIITLTIIFVLFLQKTSLISRIFKNNLVQVLLVITTIYMFERSIAPICKFFTILKCNNISDVEYWCLDYKPDTNIATNLFYSFYTISLSKREIHESIESTLNKSYTASSNLNLTLILVIGESYSKHHSNLYDYIHNTNPYLLKERNDGNLFVFNNVIAPFNLTSHVLKNLFSVNSIMERENWSSFPTFPLIFRKAGYEVYFWDNQKATRKADASDFSIYSFLYNNKIFKKSYNDTNDSTFNYDGDLIHDFYKHKVRISSKSLIIFHLMGQHTMAQNRYPHIPKFDVFTQDSINRKGLSVKQKKSIAYYDNATRYNDFILHNLMNRYRNKFAVLVYLSDHGEEIFDFRNHLGRTQELVKTPNLLKYQYEIPFMIWCSNSYIKINTKIMDRIRHSLNKPFMSDNTCQILFDLCNINTLYYHPRRDLISDKFIPYQFRQVQNSTNYDRVRWQSKYITNNK